MLLNSTPFSLREMLQDVHKMLSPSVKTGVEFVVCCETNERDWVMGDKHRLQQVLTNTAVNAVKYTLSGSITLSAKWEGQKVRFECVDTGPGIPKQEQSKLFQRFVTRGGAPGTGLGLAISKHIVDLCGGSIYFDSDPSERPGTTCVVVMPLEECDCSDLETGEMTPREEVLPIEEPLSVLIVDDVKMNRTMFGRRIKKFVAPNCELTEAATGEEALEKVSHKTFDVIIMDHYMEEAGGVMVGTDAVFAMRRMRIESTIGLCSGNDIHNEAMEAGADYCWRKPIPSNDEIIAQFRAGRRFG